MYDERAYRLGSKRSTIREIFEYAKKFDKADLKSLVVTKEEIDAPNQVIDPDVFCDPATGKYYLYLYLTFLMSDFIDKNYRTPIIQIKHTSDIR